MTNMLARITTHLDIPEDVVESIVGRPDDGSDEWHEEAWDAVEKALNDDPIQWVQYATGEDVEVV